MANTQRLGSIWKGRAWDDGEAIPRLTLPDGTIAEAMASLGYGWDSGAAVFRKILVDTSGNQLVTLAGTSTVTANQGTAAAQASRWPMFISDGAAERVGQKTMANSLPVAVASDQTVIPVSDNAGSLTIDAPVGTPAFARLSDGAAALVGQKTMALSLPVTLASDQANINVTQKPDADSLAVTATGAAAAAVTLTLPAVASQFHYISQIQIVRFATALLTAAATPVLVTTTNLPGSPVFSFDASAAAQGTTNIQQFQPASPLRSSVVNTATTIVCPATTATIWRVNVWYYAAT